VRFRAAEAWRARAGAPRGGSSPSTPRSLSQPARRVTAPHERSVPHTRWCGRANRGAAQLTGAARRRGCAGRAEHPAWPVCGAALCSSSRAYGARYVCRSRRVAATALSEITQLTEALLAAAARSLRWLPCVGASSLRGGAEPRAVLPAAPPWRRARRVADEAHSGRRARADGAQPRFHLGQFQAGTRCATSAGRRRTRAALRARCSRATRCRCHPPTRTPPPPPPSDKRSSPQRLRRAMARSGACAGGLGSGSLPKREHVRLLL